MAPIFKRLEPVVVTRMPVADAEALKSEAFRANDRGDHPNALRLWTRLADGRPDWTVAFAGLGSTLRRLGRWDEGKRVLEDSLVRFPDDPVLMVELGRVFLDRRRPEAALPLFQSASLAAPDWADCPVAVAATFCQMLRFDAADAVLRPALERFPDAPVVFANYAVAADLRGDRVEALRRWRDAHERFPAEAIGYAGMGAALKMLGRFDEADAVLDEGMRRFPDDSNIAINHAWVRVASGDWSEAMRRWTALDPRWPGDPRIQSGFAETLMQSRLAAADGEPTAGGGPEMAVPAPVASGEIEDLRTLMQSFESLGDNCELGFVQRHFGAEPLGLCRWAGIPHNELLDALASGFDGIGTPDQTHLAVNPANREYYVEDRRYRMSLHSFIIEGDTPPETIRTRMCRRLVYLKDKLLQDLRDAERIFVFNAATPLSDHQLARLHDALRAHGPVSLLAVAPSGDREAGTLTEAGPGLWRGYLGRTGYDGRIWDIEYDSWASICRQAARLHALAPLRNRPVSSYGQYRP